jgi:hypothetical protein
VRHQIRPIAPDEVLGERRGGLARHDDHDEDGRLKAPPTKQQQRGSEHDQEGEHGEAAQRGQVAGGFLQPARPDGHAQVAGPAHGQQYRPIQPVGVPLPHLAQQREENPQADTDRRDAGQEPHLGSGQAPRRRSDRRIPGAFRHDVKMTGFGEGFRETAGAVKSGSWVDS